MKLAIGVEFASRREPFLSIRILTVRIGLVGLLLGLHLGLAPARAPAHGILQGSSPRANAVLPAPPVEVVLAFNEPIDGAFSRAEVLDAEGRSQGDPAQLSANGRRLRVGLSRLAPGAYTVRWRVLSRVDGHVTSGAFVFAVGEGTQPESARPGPGTARDRPAVGDRPAVPLVITRWLALAAGLLLAGTVFFEAAVLRPLRWRPGRDAELPGLDPLRVFAGIAFVIASAAEFAAYAAVVLGTSAAIRPAMLSPLLVGTRTGWGLLVRIAMALVLLAPRTTPWRILRAAGFVWFVVVAAVIVILGGPAALGSTHVTLIVLVGTVYGLAAVVAAVVLPGIPDVRIPEGRWIRPIAAGVMLWGFTITAHAAAAGPGAVVADWLHMASAATWVGGLPSLLSTLRRLSPDDRVAAGAVLVPRVSQLAAASLGLLVVTGVFAAWRTVGGLSALAGSLYGRALVVKLVFVLAAIALGALNRFVYRPRIAVRKDARALRAFRRSVAAEIALGTVILLTVGILTVTPPAAVTQSVLSIRGITLAGIAGDLRVRLVVSPAEPGWNDLQATVSRLADGAPVVVSGIRVILTALDHAEDRIVDLQSAQGGFSASGDLLATGWWEVTVAVRLAEGTVQTEFPLIVGEVPPTASPQAEQLVREIRIAMSRYRTWREEEQITDGAGNVVRTRFEAARPDRLRYRTSGGAEAIIIGAVRYSRGGAGPWTREPLPQPLALDGPGVTYLAGASGVRMGREVPCAGETCRVLLWELERAQARFAARVGVRTHRLHSLAMVAPQHYMTWRPGALGAPVRIAPP